MASKDNRVINGATSGNMLIVTPSRGVHGSTTVAWSHMYAALATPLGYNRHSFMIPDDPRYPMGKGANDIAAKRNAACRAAIERGFSSVMFLGDDTYPIDPSTALIRLWDTLDREHKVDIVTGIYWSRWEPPKPMVFRNNPYQSGPFEDWHVGDVFPVDWAGCDCLLIPTYVLEAIPEPWFSRKYMFNPEQGEVALQSTEDIYFFRKAAEYGFGVYANSNVLCNHVDRHSGNVYGPRADMPQMIPGSEIRPKSQVGKRMADLGCGNQSPYFAGDLVRFDIDPNVKPDVLCDIRHLPQHEYGQYDIVHSSHVIEHFSPAELPDLLREWLKLLKVGGELQIRCPNAQDAAEFFAKNGFLPEYMDWQIHGQQTNMYDLHKSSWSPMTMQATLESIPWLGNVQVQVVPFNVPGSGMCSDIMARATMVKPITVPVMDPASSPWTEPPVEVPRHRTNDESARGAVQPGIREVGRPADAGNPGVAGGGEARSEGAANGGDDRMGADDTPCIIARGGDGNQSGQGRVAEAKC